MSHLRALRQTSRKISVSAFFGIASIKCLLQVCKLCVNRMNLQCNNALCKYSYGLPVWTKSQLFKELTIIERNSYLLQLYSSALERDFCTVLNKLSFLKIKSDSNYEVSLFTYYKKNYMFLIFTIVNSSIMDKT